MKGFKMKIACGTDIVEINRIEKAINGNAGEKFLDTVYTERERRYCESHYNNRFQHYAVRFAAKEAMFKALNKFSDEKIVDWKGIEVINNDDGKPEIFVKNEKIESVDISLSHCKEYAVANVVILYNE